MTWSMKLLCLIQSLVLLLALCACTPAETMPKSIAITPPASLSTVKLDADGNDLGNVNIKLSGTINDTQADIDIEPFDNFSSFVLATLESEGIAGSLQKYDFADFYYCSVGAYDSRNVTIGCILAFSPDGDYWLFSNEVDNLYYYGSISGNATTEELVEYFAPCGLQNSRPA